MADAEMTETEDYDKSSDPTDHASNHESGGSDPIDNLGPLTGLTISGDGVISWQGASLPSKYLFNLRISGDTHPRLKFRSDGQQEWGPGNAPTDNVILRHSAVSLQYITNVLLDEHKFLQRSNFQTTEFITSYVIGDTFSRFILITGGNIQFGPGNVSPDCLISRRSANIINTPDRFEAATLGVANSANATTPGNCQKKIEIFDSAGNSLGFIAVYDAIT